MFLKIKICNYHVSGNPNLGEKTKRKDSDVSKLQNNTAGHKNRGDPEGGKPRTIQQAIKIGETRP